MDASDKEYAAGFFDGDGCVYMTVERGTIYRLGIRISNVNKASLEWFKARFGGWIVKAVDKRERRKGWQWVSSAAGAPAFLDLIKDAVSIKRDQIFLSMIFLKRKERKFRFMSPVELAARETIRIRLSEMKDELDLPVPSWNATISYMSGFFDAEGSVSISASDSQSQLRVNIANTVYSSLEFLRRSFGGKIYSKGDTEHSDGCNRVQGWTLRFTDTPAANILALMRPYLIVKQGQADLGIKYQVEKELVGRRMGRFEVGLKYGALMRDMNAKSNPLAMAL
jgi:hypothetical protein